MKRGDHVKWRGKKYIVRAVCDDKVIIESLEREIPATKLVKVAEIEGDQLNWPGLKAMRN